MADTLTHKKEELEKTTKLAVKALFSYLQKKQADAGEKSLFDDGDFVYMAIALKKIPEKSRVKPFRVPLKHSLYADKSICLFTKDPHSDLKTQLAETPVQGVDKVIGVTKLRKNYRQYKDRRDLLSTYDLFLADDRITSMLPALIGKKFFEKKKHPSPVNLKRPDIAGELTRARDSTYFHLPAGSTCMVKVALTSFDPEKVAENVLSCLEAVVDHIPKKWKNIQALYLRTSDSVALPFYYSLPSAPQDATAAPATADASAAADATPAVMEDDVDAAATATGKKRKRAATAAPAVKSPEAKPTTSKPDAKAPSAKKAKAATSTQPAAPKSPAATKNVKKDAASTPVASATKPAPTGTPKAAKTPKAAPKAMIDTPRPTKTSKTTPKTATDKPAKKSTKKAAK